MTFGTPLWLGVGLVVVLGAIALLGWSHHRRRTRLAAAFPTPWLARLCRSASPARRVLRESLVILALAALAFALARPQWGRTPVRLERTGVDLVIALDVSRSMLAGDAGGTNRLATARAALHGLLDHLGGDRVGLVIFAGEAYLAAPLTRDHTAIARALDELDPTSVSEPGSDLAKAVELARRGFEPAREGPKALLIVSDGEQLRGDALASTRSAVGAGITIHTAGVGSAAGGRIPSRGPAALGLARPPDPSGTNYTRNAFGREVVTRLDEGTLQRLAAAGGGAYVRLTDPGQAGAALVAWFDRAAARLPRTTESRELAEPRERFQLPLAAVLALLAGQWLIGERRRQPGRPIPMSPKTRRL